MNPVTHDPTDLELHERFRGFLIDGNPSPLADHLREHPECARLCAHRYPALHRVCDFEAGGRAYRVCRCLSCGERLFVFPIPVAPSREPGTPYEVCGAGLARWVQCETEHPAKGPQNWGEFIEEPDARMTLLTVLRHARRLLARPENDFRWSRWEGMADALAALDKFIPPVEEGRPFDAVALSALFSGRESVQDVSLSSGWGAEFLRVAARLDAALVPYQAKQEKRR